MELVLARAILGPAHGGSADQRGPSLHVRISRLHPVRAVRAFVDRRIFRDWDGAVLLVGLSEARQRSMVGISGRGSRAAGKMGPGALRDYRLSAARDAGGVHQDGAASRTEHQVHHGYSVD